MNYLIALQVGSRQRSYVGFFQGFDPVYGTVVFTTDRSIAVRWNKAEAEKMMDTLKQRDRNDAKMLPITEEEEGHEPQEEHGTAEGAE